MNRLQKKILCGLLALLVFLVTALTGNAGTIRAEEGFNITVSGDTIYVNGQGEMPYYLGLDSYYISREYTKLVISPGITSISEAIERGDYIEEIVIPDTVTRIEEYAFRFMHSLKKVDIPKSVIDINTCAFSLSDLEHINVDADNLTYKSVDGIIYSKDGKTLVAIPPKKVMDVFYIPEGVEMVSDYAGYNSSIKKIIAPSTLRRLGDGAFQYTLLEEFNNGESRIESLGINAFAGSNLKHYTISKYTTNITNFGFVRGCDKLENITVEKDNPTLKDIDGVLYSKDGSTLIAYPNGRNADAYSIEEGTKKVACEFGKNTKAVYIPEGCEDMSHFVYTFKNCENMDAIWIPDGCFIGTDSISNKNIKNVYFGDREYMSPIGEVIQEKNDLTNVYVKTTDEEKLQELTSAGGTCISIINSGKCGDTINWLVAKEDLKTKLVIIGVGDMSAYESSADTPWYEYSDLITDVYINSGVSRVTVNAFNNLSKLERIEVAGEKTLLEDGSVNKESEELTVIAKENSEAAVYANEQGIRVEEYHTIVEDSGVFGENLDTILKRSSEYDSMNYVEELKYIYNAINPAWTDYQKILYVYSYMCEHYEYDFALYNEIQGISTGVVRDLSDVSNLLEQMLKFKMGICESFSETFFEIMTNIGIPCKILSAHQMDHAWNLVELDGKWYHIDATWGIDAYKGKVKYDNFLRSDAGIRSTNHVGDDWVLRDNRESSMYDYAYDANICINDKEYILPGIEGVITNIFVEDECWYYSVDNSLYRYDWTTNSGELIFSNDNIKQVLFHDYTLWLDDNCVYYLDGDSNACNLTRVMKYDLTTGDKSVLLQINPYSKNMLDGIRVKDGNIYVSCGNDDYQIREYCVYAGKTLQIPYIRQYVSEDGKYQMFYYEISDNELAVYDVYSKDESVTVEIPSRIDGKNVVALEAVNAYSKDEYRRSFKGIVIPESVRWIGPRTFANYLYLKNVTIKNPNCIVGYEAFLNAVYETGHDYRAEFSFEKTGDGYEGMMIVSLKCLEHPEENFRYVLSEFDYEMVSEYSFSECPYDKIITYKVNFMWFEDTVDVIFNHRYDGGKVTKEPTTQEEGIKTFTCTECGYTKTESIAKLEEPAEDEKTVEEQAKIDNVDKQFLTEEDGYQYWYENGEKQGVKRNADGTIDYSYRGKEVYDPKTDAWYWLDNVDGGRMAKSKDVYQDSFAGEWGDIINADGTRSGKWVRYDAEGHMIKGWCQGTGTEAKAIKTPSDAQAGQPVYYFDLIYGTMAKGYATVDGTEYYFNPYTGVLERTVKEGLSGFTGWKNVDGSDIWYENGIRQGYSVDSNYRGKEIYDPASNAWYWLDNIDGGKKAVNKDVYQESKADDNGTVGKWVRYDNQGHMIKGWSDDGKYYFDLTYGTMYKGAYNIGGVDYYFDDVTGIRR